MNDDEHAPVLRDPVEALRDRLDEAALLAKGAHRASRGSVDFDLRPAIMRLAHELAVCRELLAVAFDVPDGEDGFTPR